MNTTKTVDVVIPTYKPDEKYDRLLQMLKKRRCSRDGSLS